MNNVVDNRKVKFIKVTGDDFKSGTLSIAEDIIFSHCPLAASAMLYDEPLTSALSQNRDSTCRVSKQRSRNEMNTISSTFFH